MSVLGVVSVKLLLEVDRDEGLLYMTFCPDGKDPLVLRSSRTEKVCEGDVALDLDEAGHLIGVEIRNPERIGWKVGESVEIDGLVGVKEAAALLNMQKSNFVRDVAGDPSFPRPLAELASGRIWLRSDVLRYAQRTGRPTAANTLGNVMRRYVNAKGSLATVAEEMGASVDVAYRITEDNTSVREVTVPYLVNTYGLSASAAKRLFGRAQAFGDASASSAQMAARKES